jgi:uncharacterized membrane protein YhaH (DUF805 family)
MIFTDAVKSCFSKYVEFKGRSSRSEYWWFQLFYILVAIIGSVIDPILGGVVYLVLFLPLLAVSVRRLHDKDKSAWFLLFYFIPIVGAIIILVWYCQRGTIGDNQFGPESVTTP